MRFIFFINILFLLLACNRDDHKLLQVKKIDHYPSASGIEFLNDKFYVIGDDARYILVLDNEFNFVDSITLYPGSGKRMPKETKPDIESISAYTSNDREGLILTGSASLVPYRNDVWWFYPPDKSADSLRDDSLYLLLSKMGIETLNIEGTTEMGARWIMANRGNGSYKKNYLIFIDRPAHRPNDSTLINIIQLESTSDTIFGGVSGLDYSMKHDRLYLTVSVENTMSVYDDGEIGKSYLWIIDNLSSKTKDTSMKAKFIIDLETIDKAFAKQKIESVCVIKEEKDFIELGLAADNDDGSSTLFKIRLLYKK